MASCRITAAGLIMIFCASAAAAETAKCAKFLDDFDRADREIANISASGFGDDSAPRETNRQMRTVVQSLNKSMTLQLLLAHKCPVLPEVADGSGDYSFSALACRTEQIRVGITKASYMKECSVRDWKKNKDMPPLPKKADADSQCQVPPCYAPLPAAK